MYAIIESGGKQQRAVPGETLRVERLDAEVGAKVRLDRVMLVNRDGQVSVGRPYIDGASVTATVTAQDRAPKVLVFKKKKRKGYRRTRGHRQSYTALRVEAIEG
ncbi:MAG TPA: 50S ribosomal protein L21 [Vicinamibacteria bacterium]